MALHGTLPQVFAAFGAGQLEHKRVLLLTTLVIVLNHNQCESTFFKVQPCDFGPKEETDFVGSFKHQDACRSETECIFSSISALNKVHIHAVQLQPLALVEKGDLSLRWALSPEFHPPAEYVSLHGFALFGSKSKL